MKKSVLITLTLISSAMIALLLFRPETEVVNPLTNLTGNQSLDGVMTPQGYVQARSESNNELPDKLKETSLQGTEIDGLYPVDKNGNLLFSKSIKHRFEYFLSLMGEFDLNDVMALIKDDIALNLVSPAREQAVELFDDYVAYKFALSELEKTLSAPEEYELNDLERMRAQLQQMRDVRREYLPVDAVDAFFGFDEMYDDFMLAKLEIKNNQQLDESEKRQQIMDLELSLPQDVQSMRDETQRVSQVFLLTQEIQNNGGTEEDIYAVNEQEFGQEAALRLQTLNQQRNKWQSRVDTYVDKKQSIESSDELTSSEKSEQLQLLKESQFTSSEYEKLSVYELMKKESN